MPYRKYLRLARYVGSSTLAALVGALALAWVAIPLVENDVEWRHFGVVFGIVLVLAPILSLPRALIKERLIEVQRELKRLAERDSLTDLLTRRAFFARAGAVLGACGAESVAVMMIDIDHFKRVNDTFGHGVGDAVIRMVAGAIDRVAMTAAHALVARFGGEEFVVLARGLDAEAAGALASAILDEVRAAVWWHGHAAVTTTVSIGVALRGGGEGIDQLLMAADRAAYAAKRAGRDRWRTAQKDETPLQPALAHDRGLRPLRASARADRVSL